MPGAARDGAASPEGASQKTMYGLRAPILEEEPAPGPAPEAPEAEHRTVFGLRAIADDAFAVPPTPLDAGVPATGGPAAPAAPVNATVAGMRAPSAVGRPAVGLDGPGGRPGRAPAGPAASSHTMVGLSAYVPDDGGPAPTAIDDSADGWLDDIENFIDQKVADGTLDVPPDARPTGPAPTMASPPGVGPAPVAPAPRAAAAAPPHAANPPPSAAPDSRADAAPVRDESGISGFGIIRRARSGSGASEAGHSLVPTIGTEDHHRLAEEAASHRRETFVSHGHGADRHPQPDVRHAGHYAQGPAQPPEAAPAAAPVRPATPGPAQPQLDPQMAVPDAGRTMPFSPGFVPPVGIAPAPAQGGAGEPTHAPMQGRAIDSVPVEQPAALEAGAAYEFVGMPPSEPAARAPAAPARPAPVPPRPKSMSEDLLGVAQRQRLPAATTGSAVRALPAERREWDVRLVAAGVGGVVVVVGIILLVIILAGGPTVSDEAVDATPAAETE